MKKLLVTLILLMVAVLMVLTTPDKQSHKEAMMKAIREYVEEEAVDRLGDNVLADLSKNVVVKTAETALNSKLKLDNFYLFNMTHVHIGESEYKLSLGMFGHVFTFNKEMLREKLEAAIKEKAEVRTEKEEAKKSAKELKKLQKEQRKRERQLAKEQRKRDRQAAKERKRQEKEARKKNKNQ